MVDHSHNSLISKKAAYGMLGWLGIPQEFRLKALKILEEKELIKNIDRYKIKIINQRKSEHIDKKLNKLIWEEMFK